MGQHKPFESQPVFGIQIAQRLPPITDASYGVNRMRGDFILDHHSLVTNKQTNEKNAHELGIRLPVPRFRWTQARSVTTRVTPIHSAPPCLTAHGDGRSEIDVGR